MKIDQAERIMSVVVATGLAPSVVRELTTYELNALNKILTKEG